MSETNECVATVIDGNTILFTPFRYTIVPPPMSLCSLSVHGDVLEVSYSPEYQLAALTPENIIFARPLQGNLSARKFSAPPEIHGAIRYFGII